VAGFSSPLFDRLPNPLRYRISRRLVTHRFGWALSGFTARARGAPFVDSYTLSKRALSGHTLHAFRLAAGTGWDCLLYDIIDHIS